MNRKNNGYVAGIDIGAGSGAKVGIFSKETMPVAEGLLPIERYGNDPEITAKGLALTVRNLLNQTGGCSSDIVAAGVAMPGFSCSDGTIRCNNLPFLNGVHFSDILRKHMKVPVFTFNDADAGGMAEWSKAKVELLYWVLGGGWGGAWISADGRVQYPTVDWDGDDDKLHFSNEPGSAIPLKKTWLAKQMESLGGSYELFEKVCLRERNWPGNRITGPNGRDDCVRAELIVSGNGRWRLFMTFAEKFQDYKDILNDEEKEKVMLSSVAGSILDKLAEAGTEVMKRTDALFAIAIAEAAEMHFKGGDRGNCPDGIPIYVGGKPSRAFKFFAPRAHEIMAKKKLKSRMQVSWFASHNLNANLCGAAVLAWRNFREI